MGGNNDDVEAVDLAELEGLGVRGAGHARELSVEAEVVLEGGGGEGLGLVLDGHAFLGLDGLVETLGPAPPGHRAAGVLVHDDDLAVGDHVVDIATEQRVRLQGRLYVVQERQVGGRVQAVPLLEETEPHQFLLDEGVPPLGEFDLAVLFVDEEIARVLHLLAAEPGRQRRLDHLLLLELRGEPVDLAVEVRALLRRAGDDQRRSRLVDEDGVDLVDDRVVEGALEPVFEPERHVVPQVVEAELVVGAVDDVGLVRLPFDFGVLPRLDHADRHAEGLVDRAHPARVPAGKVIVDGDDVDAFPAERVQVGGEDGDHGLALAGAHLRDAPGVHHDAADELHVEVPHVTGASRGLPHGREGLGKQLLERCAAGKARAERVGAGLQFLVGERRGRLLEGVDLGDHAPHPLDFAAVLCSNDLAEESAHHAVHRGAKLGGGF